MGRGLSSLRWSTNSSRRQAPSLSNIDAGTNLITNLKSQGSANYKVECRPSRDTAVYTDLPDLTWRNGDGGCALPPYLMDDPSDTNNHVVQLMTPAKDSSRRGKLVVSFTTVHPTTVLVLYDGDQTPAWLHKHFQSAGGMIRVGGFGLEETAFSIFAASFGAHSAVQLGGNSKMTKIRETAQMYAVFLIVHAGASDVAVSSSSEGRGSTTPEVMCEDWALGRNGLSLYSNNDVVVGFEARPGTDDPVSWAPKLDISQPKRKSEAQFLVRGKEQGVKSLVAEVTSCPGVFWRSKTVTIMARYLVINSTDDHLFVTQRPAASDRKQGGLKGGRTNGDGAQCLHLPPHSKAFFHWSDASGPKEMLVRCGASGRWSEGAIRPDDWTPGWAMWVETEEGSSSMQRGSESKASNSPQSVPSLLDRRKLRLIHVEVKPSGPDTHAYANVLFYSTPQLKRNHQPSQKMKKSSVAASTALPLYVVRNHSPATIVIAQQREREGGKVGWGAWTVLPGEEHQLGWFLPNQKHSLRVLAVDPNATLPTGSLSSLQGSGKWGYGSQRPALRPAFAEISGDMLDSPSDDSIACPMENNAVVGGHDPIARVLPNGGTKVILFTFGDGTAGKSRRRSNDTTSIEELTTCDPRVSVEVRLNVGVSVIAVDAARGNDRAEMLHLHAIGLRTQLRWMDEKQLSGKYRSKKVLHTCVELKHVQVDNYMSCAVFPVILHPKNVDEGNGVNAVLQLDVIQVTSSGDEEAYGAEYEKWEGGGTTMYDLIVFKILELSLMVDLPSVLRIVSILQPLTALSGGDAYMARISPKHWVQKLTKRLIDTSPEHNDAAVRLSPKGEADLMLTIGGQTYFGSLVLGPILFSFSFVQAPVSKSEVRVGLNAMQLLGNLSTIKSAPVKFRGYEWTSVVSTRTQLLGTIAVFYSRQIVKQILTLAGSMSAIGNPVDLVNNVGTGFKDFFVEPAQGARQGLGEFVRGVRTGTTSLGTNVAHGALSSAAGIGQTVNRTAEMLAFDAEWKANRERKRTSLMVNNGGFGKGFMHGVDSVVGGVADGVTGIISKPMEGAQKGGFAGFGMGLAQGLVGAVAKPVLGVSEAFVGVVQGASNATDDGMVYAHVRPQRAMVLDPATMQLHLAPLDTDAAFAQAALNNRHDHHRQGRGVDGKWRPYVAHHMLRMSVEGNSEPLVMVVFTRRKLFVMCLYSAKDGIPQKKDILALTWNEISHVEMLAAPAQGRESLKPGSSSSSSRKRKGNLFVIGNGGAVDVHVYGGGSASESKKQWTPCPDDPVEWMQKRSGSPGRVLRLFCHSRGDRDELHDKFLKHANAMGDTQMMVTPDAASASKKESKPFHRTYVGAEGNVVMQDRRRDTYRFGRANAGDGSILQGNRSSQRSTDDMFKEVQEMWTQTAGYMTREKLDLECWSIVNEWVGSSRNMMGSKKKMILLLLLNEESNVAVQVFKPQLVTGGSVIEIAATKTGIHGSFHEHSRSLKPGGALLMVAWGKNKSLFNNNDSLTVEVETALATLRVTQNNGGVIKAQHSSFTQRMPRMLENSRNDKDEWCKVVIAL